MFSPAVQCTAFFFARFVRIDGIVRCRCGCREMGGVSVLVPGIPPPGGL
jgi:hypothetical protein